MSDDFVVQSNWQENKNAIFSIQDQRNIQYLTQLIMLLTTPKIALK